MRSTNLALDCAAGERLLPIDEAFAAISGEARTIDECERVPLAAAVGRVISRDLRTSIPLPPFDHSAVDGFGLTAADLDRPPPHRLRLAGRIAAGGVTDMRLAAGEAVRLFTGAPVPADVKAVILEERCRLEAGSIVLTVPVPDGANIRRRGEDVADQSTIVDAGTILDARHVAILAAAGLSEIEVRRRIRVAVLSTGDDLRRAGVALEPGAIYDSNRPMLSALLARPWIEIVTAQHVKDEAEALAGTLRWLASESDIVISSGGAAGSDTDHTARAIGAAGGRAWSLRIALRPGKPVVVGRIGSAVLLGLPGNPVAALVNFLLFGRALVLGRAGAKVERPRGQAAVVATRISHAAGRTEFAPARIVGFQPDGRPRIEKLGRGGSARLRPLVVADGFAEIPANAAELDPGAPVAFHPFHAAFAT
jgi:molybdopterin molybdotransferase